MLENNRVIDSFISIPSNSEISKFEYQESGLFNKFKYNMTNGEEFIKPNYSNYETEFLNHNSGGHEHNAINDDITLIPLYVHMVAALL